jgi:hypothetical protein
VRIAEKATPIVAAIAALSSLACCLPFAFIGAVGLAGVGSRIQVLRPWLLAASGALLVIGFVHLYFRRNRCERRSRLSIAIFWIATAMVLLLILFPQIFASLVAG